MDNFKKENTKFYNNVYTAALKCISAIESDIFSKPENFEIVQDGKYIPDISSSIALCPYCSSKKIGHCNLICPDCESEYLTDAYSDDVYWERRRLPLPMKSDYVLNTTKLTINLMMFNDTIYTVLIDESLYYFVYKKIDKIKIPVFFMSAQNGHPKCLASINQECRKYRLINFFDNTGKCAYVGRIKKYGLNYTERDHSIIISSVNSNKTISTILQSASIHDDH